MANNIRAKYSLLIAALGVILIILGLPWDDGTPNTLACVFGGVVTIFGMGLFDRTRWNSGPFVITDKASTTTEQ